jgi:hypothetical protein
MDAAISTVEFYVLTCEEPRPGTHERLIAPLWKQSLGFAIHCVAGDTTGIGVAATITTSIVPRCAGDADCGQLAAAAHSRNSSFPRTPPPDGPGCDHERAARLCEAAKPAHWT